MKLKIFEQQRKQSLERTDSLQNGIKMTDRPQIEDQGLESINPPKMRPPKLKDVIRKWAIEVNTHFKEVVQAAKKYEKMFNNCIREM